jgi:hypothetical protein
MEFLRDLFGNAASGIIRLAVAVGVLAAPTSSGSRASARRPAAGPEAQAAALRPK